MQKVEIIFTCISDNKRVMYGIFRHETAVDEEFAVSYGIFAAEPDGNTVSVYDVYTDYSKVESLLLSLKSKSVPLNLIKEYIIDYISEN